VYYLNEYSINKLLDGTGEMSMPRIKEQFETMRSTARQKITSAGLQLFSSRGLAATSIQDIASLAGISTGLMYHYYKSKDELFVELVRLAVNSANDSARLIFDLEQSPAEKIRLFTHEVITEITQGDQIGQFFLLMTHYILGDGMVEKDEKIQENGTANLEWMKRIIIEGQALGELKPGSPDAMALTYFATIQGLAIYKLTLGQKFTAPSEDLLNSLLIA
jgi:AcrR family transcriptional regulator